jgi:hypothetical protein
LSALDVVEYERESSIKEIPLTFEAEPMQHREPTRAKRPLPLRERKEKKDVRPIC